MKKYLLQFVKYMSFGGALVLGMIITFVGVYAFTQWNNLKVESNTPLTKDLWNDLVANVQEIDDKLKAPLEDLGNGVIRDKLTDKEWQKDGISAGQKTWVEAKNYCQNLSLDGGGWSLPSKEALQSLYNHISFGGQRSLFSLADGDYGTYWSSRTTANDADQAWVLHFMYGIVGYNAKSNGSYVLCVR